MSLTRRHLILAGAAASLSSATRSAAAPASGASGGLITLSPNPVDLEMPAAGFVDEITPVERFFVRCHSYTPDVKLADWKLEVGGLVARPLSLTLDDLKKLPRVRLTSVLECAGNGRAFYEPRLPGAQWRFGGVGNAVWTGARLRDVLKRAGLKPEGTHLLLDGADAPARTMPDFQRSLPALKCLHPDTLLAWEMNGRPLTAQHGFPLRVIAPGWAGDSWVKWLRRIEALDHEFDGFWMKTAYRHPVRPVEPGAVVDPKDMTPVTDLNVKSAIGFPGEWVRPGRVTVQGVAWSNASPVTRVDVSADGGTTWAAARLAGTPTRYGFRKWTYVWEAAEGEHALLSRAANQAGETQPMKQAWNPSGYLWNVAQPRAVVVARTAPSASVPPPSAAEAAPPEGYRAACLTCHDEHMMRQQRLTPAQWDREITKMTNWGAPVKSERRKELLDYLAARFRP